MQLLNVALPPVEGVFQDTLCYTQKHLHRLPHTSTWSSGRRFLPKIVNQSFVSYFYAHMLGHVSKQQSPISHVNRSSDIPKRQWEAQVLQMHPEVLETRERFACMNGHRERLFLFFFL